ncbi:pseudouridine synthase [Rozella allomycis CSF55]|uniref:Pseudouridine synthase n=1 Tax=Rozella allomycis (strain CSF55) TaxID=988480 RepID=A0A075ANN8_ROZAC|nr:Pseudouridine synthase, catalytic domain-containing protein [Rozella allomycis CSF55]RKP19861.1 pseudouridine synthase [Rozella allomycis CSF55]|eukprot:EPZ31502.1 Pseudouridine synthase, catalytic domain-containing protein [Rozella allomycis CSF55]
MTKPEETAVIEADQSIPDKKRVLEEEDSNEVQGNEKKRSGSKRKMALMVGYSGTGYHGLHHVAGTKTIEDDIFKALCDAGCVDSFNQVKVGRACRTDKGVHAAANLLTAKVVGWQNSEEIVKKINEKLPPQIKLYITKGFDAKFCCSGRIYEYLLPTYLLKSNIESFEQGQSLLKESLENALNKKIERITYDEINPTEIEEMKKYRIDADTLTLLRDLLNRYVGTQSFHNFTRGLTFGQSRARRFHRSFTASDPFMVGDTEYVSLKVDGQAFLMHQIRKMIGFVVMIIRYKAKPEDIWDRAFGSAYVNIPRVPGLGLLLEQPFFKTYNCKAEKLEAQQKKKTNEFERVDFADVSDQVDAFKHNVIYPTMMKAEVETNEYLISDYDVSKDDEKLKELRSKLYKAVESDNEEDNAEDDS